MSALAVEERPSGLAMLEAIRDGAWPPPPTATLLDLELTEVVLGRVAFVFRPQERFSNGLTTHGGILATVADFAVSCAVITCLPLEAGVVTSRLTVDYVAPVLLDGGPVRCEGRVDHLARRLALSRATMVDEAGKPVLRATATLRFRVPSVTS